MNRQKMIIALSIGFLFALCLISVACTPSSDTSSDGNPVGENEEATGNEGMNFTWTADSDCTPCHKNPADSLDGITCEAAHQTTTTESCMTCHDDEMSLSTAHEGVTTTDADMDGLDKTTIKQDTCLGCHTESELVTTTASVTALTDHMGTTVNPHEVMTVHNVNNGHGGINCGSCHKMHSDEPTEEIASKLCLSCHHEDVYECYTCH